MKLLKNIFISFFFAIALFMPLSPAVQAVSAQTGSNNTSQSVNSDDSLLCQVFPFIKGIDALGVSNICSGNVSEDTATTLAQKVIQYARFAVSLIFVGIIIVAVYIVIKAALKYIRSEGDDKKIEEAQKAIKSVFVGLIALFIGIIGLVLILVLFQATDAVNQNNTPDEIDVILNGSGS